jgi:S1/P1 Nuclease
MRSLTSASSAAYPRASILAPMQTVSLRRIVAGTLAAALSVPVPSFGWGSDGHRMINHLAASTLPSDVPAFLRSTPAIDEIEYLGPEPDRWRSRAEPELGNAQAPEHFIDFEPADALGPLPRNRLDFEASVFAHNQRPEKIGLQPWETLEVWQRLKAALREYRRLASPASENAPDREKDLHSVEQAAIFYAGWLGHYVGDGSQPLHTTINYDGWTLKDNPNGYTTAHGIHSRFESQFVSANIKSDAVEKKMTEPKAISGDVFDSYVAYLRHTASQIDAVYTFDKAGGFDKAGTAESRAFTEERLAAGASELRDLIYTAWIDSAAPVPERY